MDSAPGVSAVGDVIVMFTDGGAHPASKWANVSARQISNLIQIDEQSFSDAAVEGRKAKSHFAEALAEGIEILFEATMKAETDLVGIGAVIDRQAPFQIENDVDGALLAFDVALLDTPFVEHFLQPDVRLIVRNILKQNFIDAANVSRLCAFDAKGL